MFILSRILACLFAIILLWLTSLRVVVHFITSIVQVPSYTTVEKECKISWDIIEDQNTKYKSCAIDETSQCFQYLYKKENDIIDNINNSILNNEIVYNKMKNISNECDIRKLYYIDIINTYLDASVLHLVEYNNGSDFHDNKYKLQSILKNVNNDVKANLFTKTMKTLDSSIIEMSNIGEHVHNLGQYNEDYVRNKSVQFPQDLSANVNLMTKQEIQQMTSELNIITNKLKSITNCIQSLEDDQCVLGTSVLSVYESIHEAILADVTFLKKFLDDFIDEIAYAYGHISELYNILEDAKSFYDTIQKLPGILQSPLSGTGINICRIDGSNWCNVLPFDYNSIEMHVPIKDNFVVLNNPIDSTALKEILQPIADTITDTATSVETFFEDSLEDFTDSINEVLSTGESFFDLSDYNPPTYNISKVVHLQKKKDMETKIILKNGLLHDQLYANALQEDLSQYEQFNSSIFFNMNYNGMNYSTYDTKLKDPSWTWLPSMDISLFGDCFDSINGILYLCDTLYRIISTLHTVLKHWKGSEIPLPSVDHSQAKSRSTYMHELLNDFYKFLPTLCYATLFLFIFVMLALAMGMFYWPMYMQYKSACIDGSESSSYFSSTLRSMASNYAVSNGDAIIQDNLIKYNEELSNFCAVYENDGRFIDHQMMFQETQHVYQRCSEDLNFMSRVINMTRMNNVIWNHNSCGSITEGSMLNDVCSWYSGMLEGPLGYTNYTSIENLNLPGKYQDVSFDCQSLPTCEISCNGVHDPFVESASLHCSCMTEWKLHASIMSIFLCLFVFVSINISRYLIVNGIFTVFWRSLQPHQIQFIGTLEANGNLLFDKTKQQCNSDTNLNLKASIRRAIWIFLCRGYLMLFLSIVVTIPWFILLSDTQDTLQYDGVP